MTDSGKGLGGGAVVHVDDGLAKVDSRSAATKHRAARSPAGCTALMRRDAAMT